MQNKRRSRGAAGLISMATILGLFGTGMISACNTNPVTLLSGGGQISVARPTPIGGQIPMDILWVIDNSFSMCQEQKVLRDNFDQFIAEIQKTNLDFHISVTTTHAPESGFSIEPIAQEGVIQSTPQPVPGNNETCLRDTETGSYAPFRESLDIAKACLADPSTASSYDWSDDQIACALLSPNAQQSSGCLASTGLSDRNGDMAIDAFDLFPAASEYRAIPKVLRATDYRDASGNLDAEKLRQDFACMSTVGTRGDGYEKGLRAAVTAVSLDKTGGAFGVMTSDMTKPNYGFVRKDAGFALIFVTDENDCSHDGSVEELRNTCGNNICEYLNSSAISEGDTPLIAPEVFAEELRQNLADTKGIEVDDLSEDSLLIASIHGTWQRFAEPLPACADGEKPEVSPVCVSPTGEAFSGDRYERFIRQFRNHYPNTVASANPEDRLNFEKTEPLGWICSTSFVPALQAIGEFIAGTNPSCIREDVFICEDNSECPNKLFTDTPGTCNDFPGKEGQKYCDSGLVLKIERDPTVEATFPEVGTNPYCLPNSVNELSPDSCVIDPSLYSWVPCGGGNGIQYQWQESSAAVSNKLSGYTLKLIYNLSIVE